MQRCIIGVILVTGILIYSLFINTNKPVCSPVDLVNQLMGTDSEFSLSSGKLILRMSTEPNVSRGKKGRELSVFYEWKLNSSPCFR